MSLMTLLMAVTFTILAAIVAVCMVIDVFRCVAESFADEIREIPVECKWESSPDKFEALYVSVADGDRGDRAYWLGSVKGGERNAQK